MKISETLHRTDEISEISIGTRILKKASTIHQRHYRLKNFKNKCQNSLGQKLLSPDRPLDFDQNKAL